MLKSFILCALVAMLVSGTAWAQTEGPAYYKATNTLLVGTQIDLNPNWVTTPSPKPYLYLTSSVDAFKVSGYRYINGAWTKVFPRFMKTTTDTALTWPYVNQTLPIHVKVDRLFITSNTSGGTVEVLSYD